ncbi:MAG: NADH-quinone oxidoreductase subunit N [Methylococcaceae bacterium]|nr:NADH-quinone oxidoreductase subunit N [Methylococcaceae bacterium]
MTFDGLLALLPIILSATAAIVVMLGIAVCRSHSRTVNLTLYGLIATLITLPLVGGVIPIQVTPLIIMDSFSVFFIAMIAATGIVVTLLCRAYFGERDSENEELYLLLLTAVLGAVVLVSSRHFAALFLGLETMSVSLFAMIAYTVRNEFSLEAGVKYLILSAISSSFLLFGSALVYAEFGSLVFSDMLSLATTSGWTPLTAVGLSMVVVGLAFKLSLVPFHLWTSDVYQGAPAPVTAFVATVSKGAVFALLLRYFASADLFQHYPVYAVISLLAMASILVGNFLALQQNDLKRLLAYSSIAHMGYLLIPFVAGISLGKEVVIESLSFYLVAYFITTLGAFGMISVMTSGEKEMTDIADYRGLFWKKPGSAVLMTAIFLSLAGIPLTAGFIGKFYIFYAGVQASLWPLIFVLVIGSGIGLYYYLRVIVAMLEEPGPLKYAEEPLGAFLALAGLGVLVIILGVYPSPLSDLIYQIARTFGV